MLFRYSDLKVLCRPHSQCHIGLKDVLFIDVAIIKYIFESGKKLGH